MARKADERLRYLLIYSFIHSCIYLFIYLFMKTLSVLPVIDPPNNQFINVLPSDRGHAVPSANMLKTRRCNRPHGFLVQWEAQTTSRFELPRFSPPRSYCCHMRLEPFPWPNSWRVRLSHKCLRFKFRCAPEISYGMNKTLHIPKQDFKSLDANWLERPIIIFFFRTPFIWIGSPRIVETMPSLETKSSSSLEVLEMICNNWTCQRCLFMYSILSTFFVNLIILIALNMSNMF